MYTNVMLTAICDSEGIIVREKLLSILPFAPENEEECQEYLEIVLTMMELDRSFIEKNFEFFTDYMQLFQHNLPNETTILNNIHAIVRSFVNYTIESMETGEFVWLFEKALSIELRECILNQIATYAMNDMRRVPEDLHERFKTLILEVVVHEMQAFNARRELILEFVDMKFLDILDAGLNFNVIEVEDILERKDTFTLKEAINAASVVVGEAHSKTFEKFAKVIFELQQV